QKLNGKPEGKPSRLDVKLLIIDPCSNGAYLRASAEARDDYFSPRLFHDVTHSMEHFLELVKIAKSDQGGKVNFEAKIYRTPPILYLVWTPNISFVQQYHFWSTHKADINIPIIKYHKQTGAVNYGRYMHDDLKKHFDWVWDHAAVPIDEYLEKHCPGIDCSGRNANIKNIYYNSDYARDRIIHLINNSNDTLWIKGITLNSFFKDGLLHDAIWNKFIESINQNKKIDFKVLLIDPFCEQAEIRSFREYMLTNKDAELVNFNKSIKKTQKLYRDLATSMSNIKLILNDLDRLLNDKGIKDIQAKNIMKVKFFRSAPEAFLLITDESVLIEQYHYGSKEGKKILSGGVPLLEYQKCPDLGDYVFDGLSMLKNDKTMKDPYSLFKDHFKYVFQSISRNHSTIPVIQVL
ncbi:MAG: hypothetical protein P8078_10800, partial [bacterium]